MFREGLPREPPYPEEEIFNSGPGITGFAVPPNGRDSAPSGYNITEDEMRLWTTQKATLTCFGKIVYRDIWKRDHVTRFLYAWTVIDPAEPQRMRVTPVGPDTWMEYT